MPTQLHSFDIVEVTADIPSVGADTTEENPVTVPGVRAGDFVAVEKPSHTTGVMYGSCRVSADDTVQVQMVNPTASGVDPSSETLRFMVFRPVGGVHTAVVP